MGRIGNGIARLLSFTRVVRNGANQSDVKFDPGGGAIVTGEHFAAPGDDSFPLPTDYLAFIEGLRAGGRHVVGYADPINVPIAAAGEKRIYARDPVTGAVIGWVHLKGDGEIEASNGTATLRLLVTGAISAVNPNAAVTLGAGGNVSLANSAGGSITLKAGGSADINGATIDLAGNVVTAGGKSLDTHIHSGVQTGAGNTGPPV